MIAVYIVVALAAGVAAGYLIRRSAVDNRLKGAQGEAQSVLRDAQREAETVVKEARLEAKEELHRVRSEVEGDLRERRLELKTAEDLSLIHISEPTRRTPISYAVFCLKK